MKQDITKVNMLGKNDSEGNWYSWIETCDRCKNIIQEKEYLNNNYPDTDEPDFCINCLEYLLSNKIPYEEIEYKKSGY